MQCHKMKRHNIYKPVLLWLSLTLISLIGISACSSGPAEKPLTKSITSPALLLDQGVQQYNNNDYQRAISYFEKSLLQYRSIDNQTGITQCSLNLAKSLMAINNDQLAAEYLIKADTIIKKENLDGLSEHLQLLKSSLAIRKASYDAALHELEPVLNSKNSITQLAALKNRTKIAFIKNDDDRQLWLNKYKTQQLKTPETTKSHQARILRFESKQASDTETQTALLKRSLSISRDLANRPAIAATLTQWAAVNMQAENVIDAEDQLLRALFIRHQLGDVKNSLLLLQQLNTIYLTTDNKKQATTHSWINKLSSHELDDWKILFLDFETYPKTR